MVALFLFYIQGGVNNYVFIAKDFSAFLLDSSQDNLNNLIKKIEVFIRELFDPNYRKRETSLMRVCRLLLSPS